MRVRESEREKKDSWTEVKGCDTSRFSVSIMREVAHVLVADGLNAEEKKNCSVLSIIKAVVLASLAREDTHEEKLWYFTCSSEPDVPCLRKASNNSRKNLQFNHITRAN